MPDRWNPNSPTALGLEYSGIGVTNLVVDAWTKQFGYRFTAAAAAVLDHLQVYSLPNPYGGHPFVVDIVPRASEYAGATQIINNFNPSAVSGVSGWTNTDTTALNAAAITSGGQGAISTYNGQFDVQFGSGAYSLTANQIYLVQIMVVCKPPASVLSGASYLQVSRVDPGGVYSGVGAIIAPVGVTTTDYVGYGDAWLEAGSSTWTFLTGQMIRDFASGGTRKIRIKNSGAQATPITISAVQMQVYAVAERRVACGVGVNVGGGAQWLDAPLQKPDKSGSFSTLAATDYTAIIRRGTPYAIPGGGGLPDPTPIVLTMPLINGTSPFPLSAVQLSVLSAASPPQPYSTGGVQAFLTGTPVVKFRTGTTDRAESQPYVSADALGVTNSSVANTQTLTAVASGAYPIIKALVAAEPTATGALTFRVKITGGAYITVLATVTKADLDALPTIGVSSAGFGVAAPIKQVLIDFSALGAVTSLVNGTGYTVEITAPASNTGGWKVGGLWLAPADVGVANAEANTYGGAAQAVGGISGVDGDLCVVLLTKPTAPTALAASVQTQVLVGSSQ